MIRGESCFAPEALPSRVGHRRGLLTLRRFISVNSWPYRICDNVLCDFVRRGCLDSATPNFFDGQYRLVHRPIAYTASENRPR
jgi:hypothetical protein